MADTKISALTDGTTADATDRIPVARDPTGTPLSRYVTPAYINTYIVGLANTWTGDNVFAPSGDVIEQYRSTNAQQYRLYNTRTDASNYERGFFRWTSNQLRIGSEKAGTGAARDVYFYRDGTAVATLTSSGMQMGAPIVGGQNLLYGFNWNNPASTTDGSDTTAGQFRTNRGATGTVTRTMTANVSNLIYKRVASFAFRIEPPTGTAFRRANGTLEANDKYLELASDGATVWIMYDGANMNCIFESGTINVEP